MKIRKHATLSIMLAALLFASCGNSTDSKEKPDSKTSDSSVQALGAPQPPMNHYDNTIPFEAIQAMINSYSAPGSGQAANSKSGWVSYQTLSNFVNEIKRASEIRGVDLNNVGIRFYFAAYPQQKTGESAYFSDIPTESRNKHTFLLLPTFRDANSINRDATSGTNDNKMFQISNNHELIPLNGQNTLIPNAQQLCIGLNHMGLCPPECPN